MFPAPILNKLENAAIFRHRGSPVRRRKIPIISSVASTVFASLRKGVEINSILYSNPLRAPLEFVQRRQLCNFALVNARSIRNKTLMLNKFII